MTDACFCLIICKNNASVNMNVQDVFTYGQTFNNLMIISLIISWRINWLTNSEKIEKVFVCSNSVLVICNCFSRKVKNSNMLV